MRAPFLAAGAALLVLGTAPLAAQQAAPATALIPASTFADRPSLSALSLSPDGGRIAAIERSGDTARLLVFRAGEQRDPHYYEVGKRAITDVDWAGPDHILITVTVYASFFGLQLPVSRLIAIDLNTHAFHEIDSDSSSLGAGDVLYVDPKGQWMLLAVQQSMTKTPLVKRIDLATGAVTVVEKARPDIWSWFADGNGVVRAGIAYDDNRWTMWYRSQADAPLTKVRSTLAKGLDGSIDSVHFFPGEETGVIVTNAKSDRFAAYRFDFRTGEIGDEIYANPQVDVDRIIGNPVTRALSGIAYEDERHHVAWIEPAMQALQAKLDRALPGLDNLVIDRSLDGNRLLIWSAGASDSGTYYLFDIAARRLERLVRPYEKLGGVPLATVQPVRYAARDGVSIPGYLTLPRGRDPHALPLIVMPHGGPFARDSWDYDPFVQFLASRGYAVLQPNFRGSTGYGKQFVELGYGQWGRKMQDDLDDGMDWLVQTGVADPKRVCIMGASYGGYAALWGAIRNPERYRCAVSLAGVTDLPGMLKTDKRTFSAPRYFKQWESKVQGEKDTDLKALSPLAQAVRMTRPVLIGHGEKDSNVPAKQAHDMVAALAARKGSQPEVVSVFYKDEGHGLTDAKDLTDFFERLDAFLVRHNPADAAKQ
ncbi:S9 family peptidase [Sphingomonas sp. HITSZ_GF]|uniref:alpha/beta hydrolase family protein n=1 Tax=Sphingomonas sp. HITSZ_GF TaxID=3037247 RepID=UPI00240D7C97|nr:S9 family peptidase [Sphingomonas sp. HITSZ_GF]MDG2535558.1 S9 family peptidase [Sphingomonas sp. HITSZ_GF]